MKAFQHLGITMAIALTSAAIATSCSSNDDKDTTYPQITAEGITANPVDCQNYKRGDIIPVRFMLTDDTELGDYNIEIHSNFDHHTHSTSTAECEDHEGHEEHHEGSTDAPWHFSQDYTIPAGQRSYMASHDIAIPTDIATGDYHFTLRLTDRAGWQQLHAVSIQITE